MGNMATFAFYNIGQANKEITRLAARIAELEAAKPADHSAQLADAIASNETVSLELAAVQSAVAGLKADLAAKTSALDQLNTSYSTLSTELSQACLAANCDVAADATPSAKLAALKGAVNAAIAKTGVNIHQLPAPGAKIEATAGKELGAECAKLHGPERTAFYRKNKAAIDLFYATQS